MGPVEVKLHNLQIDKAHIEVYYRPKSGLPSVADKLREQIIKNTCEAALLTVLYPRAAITVQIYEMEDNGGVSEYKFKHSLPLLNLFIYFNHFVSFAYILVDCLRYKYGMLGTSE